MIRGLLMPDEEWEDWVDGHEKLTPTVQDRICNALRAGATVYTAANLGGVTKQTFYNWCKRGKDHPRGRYGKFLKAVNMAIQEGKMRDLAIIGKAAEQDWKAAAWRLERRFPDEFAKRDQLQVTGGTNNEVVVTYVNDFRQPTVIDVPIVEELQEVKLLESKDNSSSATKAPDSDSK